MLGNSLSESDKAEVLELLDGAEMMQVVRRLTATVEDLTKRLSAAEGRLRTVEEKSSEIEEAVDDIGDDVDEVARQVSGADGDDNVGTGAPPAHIYEVVTTFDGKVLCFLPKDPDGTYLPAAMGGKHLGSSSSETADQDAGPYPAGGPVSGSNRPEWARYGWKQIGTIDTTSETVNDKLVVATFVIPRDPPDDKINNTTEVQGPKLAGVALYDADSWKNYSQQTWKEFDDKCSSLVRQVILAHIANGLVTQLTMTPYFYAPPLARGCDGGSDSDSDGSEGDQPSESSCHPLYYLEKYGDCTVRLWRQDRVPNAQGDGCVDDGGPTLVSTIDMSSCSGGGGGSIVTETKCVCTGITVSASGVTFTRENVLVVAGAQAGNCESVTIPFTACEDS